MTEPSGVPATMAIELESLPEQERKSTGQTFLVGVRIYLRPLEANDATYSSAWRDSPFPASAKTAEAELEKQVPGDRERQRFHLVACRIADDQPVGSVLVDFRDEWPTAYGHLFVAAIVDEERQDIKAEMIALLAPWLSDERGAISIIFDLEGGEPAVITAAEGLGFRPAFRIRDAIWRSGGRHDWVAYQKLHPTWVERLGDPGAGLATASDPVAKPSSPAPRQRAPGSAPLPANTIVASERLALRPLETDDAEAAARSFMEETETTFGSGRIPFSPIALSANWGRAGEHDPPETVEFAVVLRETDEVIGEIGLYLIDWIGRSAETGSWVHRSQHRGGGLGTEAKHLLLEYAFERLGLHLVWSYVLNTNKRSAAALRKQGYRDAGRIDWIGVGRGEFLSAHLFDLFAEEWRAARR